MDKFLIIRFSSIGDIVLTSPVIRCLRQAYPEAKIHFITKKVYASIPDANPFVDRVITIDQDIDEVREQLKLEHYDYIIDLHHNLRSNRLRKKLRRPGSGFPKLNFKKLILTQFKWNLMPELHIVDRYFKAVEGIGVINDHRGLEYYVPSGQEVDPAEFGFRSPFIAVVIGAKFNTKRLPSDLLEELIGGIHQTCVLIGGPEDEELGNQLAGRLENTVSVCGQLSIHQSASLIRQAQKVITHDTGMMHIASAFKKSIHSIWGNTVPSLGMFPYLPGNEDRSIIHEVKESCRPCSKIGYDSCPKKHFRCMKNQNIAQIISAVNSGD